MRRVIARVLAALFLLAFAATPAFAGRSFNGTSSRCTGNISPGATAQLTIAFWLNWTTFANNDALATETTNNYNNTVGGIIIDPNDAVQAPGFFTFGVRVNANTFPNGYTLKSFTRPAAGTLHHYAFVADGTQTGAAIIQAIYVDGVAQSLTTIASATTSLSAFATTTLNFMSRAGTSLFGAGSMADWAAWNTQLTSLDVKSLAQGMRPYRVQPRSLIAFYPLDGIVSPEADLSGSVNNMTCTNTTQVFGPPLNAYTPRRPF